MTVSGNQMAKFVITLAIFIIHLQILLLKNNISELFVQQVLHHLSFQFPKYKIDLFQFNMLS